MLYSGGFFSQNDKNVMAQVRNSSADKLRDSQFSFEDKRLPEMLFRYRARNYPESLSPEEKAQWQEFCFSRLTQADEEGAWVMDECHLKVEQLLAAEDCTEEKRKILEALLDYTDTLLAG